MKRKPIKRVQPLADEIKNALMEFVRTKFYCEPGDDRRFAQDRKWLLAWVVLWPACWFNQRGVTIHGDEYKRIFFKVMLDADAHRSEKIKYRPAWLRHVLQSHFRMHGDEYYEQAKSIRSVCENLVLLAGQRQAAPDPVRELASAQRILAAPIARKTRSKPSVNAQLNLFS